MWSSKSQGGVAGAALDVMNEIDLGEIVGIRRVTNRVTIRTDTALFRIIIKTSLYFLIIRSKLELKPVWASLYSNKALVYTHLL